MLKILQKFRKKDENIQKTIENLQKVPISFKAKELLKKTLIWFNLYDKQNTIDEIIDYWSKSLLLWIFNVFITGSLILMAVLPFYQISLKSVPFIMFSFGIAYYIAVEMLKEARSIIKFGAGGRNG